MSYKPQPGALPPGYDSRFITGDEYIQPLVFSDNEVKTEIVLPEEVSDAKLYWGSNCPAVTIPRHPMWDVKQNWRK